MIARKNKYEKTEFSFNIPDIAFTRIVSRNTALNCIAGYTESSETKSLSPLLKLFAKPVLQIAMEGSFSMFFDIMRASEFVGVLQDS
jgi:hypothetical protein